MIFEIIMEFNPNDLNSFSENMLLKNTELITRNVDIVKTLKQFGYKIKYLEFGANANPLTYAIQQRAIDKIQKLRNHMQKITYKNANIFEGFKLVILDSLIQIERIKSVLDEKKNNIVFLYNEKPGYFFYALPDIAKRLGYETKYGVSTISNSKISPLDFIKETRTSAYDFAYNPDVKPVCDDTIEDTISDIMKHLHFEGVENPQYAFFLETTDEEFYTVSIYPVLDKFKEKNIEYVIFTWDERTTKILQKRGYKVHDLFAFMMKFRLDLLMMQKRQDIFLQFFDGIQNFMKQTDDIVLKSFIKYFTNDRNVIDLSFIIVAIEIINEILKKFKFRSILVGADGSMYNDLVCNIAKNRCITTYSILPLHNTHFPLFSVLYNADHLFAYGDNLKKEMMKLGISSDRLIVVGNPKFDYIKQSSMKPNGPKRLIIVANSRMHENDEHWMSELIKYCNKKDLDVLIKLHPGYRYMQDSKRTMKYKINKIKENCSGLKYEISYDANLKELWSITSILITEFSSVGAEASLNDIPIIVETIDDVSFYDHSLQYHKEGIALHAGTLEELFNNIDKILNDEETKKRLEEGRKIFNYRYNYLNDGKASDRIFERLTGCSSKQ